MKGFQEVNLLLISGSDIGAFTGIAAVCVAIVSVIFSRLGNILKDKADITTIRTQLDRALDDIEKHEDDISEVKIKIEHIDTNCRNFHNIKP